MFQCIYTLQLSPKRIQTIIQRGVELELIGLFVIYDSTFRVVYKKLSAYLLIFGASLKIKNKEACLSSRRVNNTVTCEVNN